MSQQDLDLVMYDEGDGTDSPTDSNEASWDENEFNPFAGFMQPQEQSITTVINLPRFPGAEDSVSIVIESSVNGSNSSVEVHTEGDVATDDEWYSVVQLIGSLMGRQG